MNFKKSLGKLHSDPSFIKWKRANKNCYLIYGFYSDDGNIKSEWQLGYYDKESDMITAFAVNDTIQRNPETKAFKDGGVIEELKVEDVKTPMTEAISCAEEIQKSQYDQHCPVKKIIVLQKLPIGLVWNITYITKTFNTLNMKIDALTGKVLKHELVSVFRVEK
ncbi:hypothetical protein JW930_06550 [Candidatus Woesearchaeota archaeon]|nr:hypothetical protein [Candidatus Woesearchaeota archaeon]